MAVVETKDLRRKSDRLLGSVFVAGLLFVALSVLPVRRWSPPAN